MVVKLPPRPHKISLPRLDPLKNPFRPYVPTHAAPRIMCPGFIEPHRLAPTTRSLRLALRLAALARALDDLPGHAKRFARWKAARDAAGAQNKGRAAGRIRRTWALRPGRPPGHRCARCRRPVHEVHDILDSTHGLAFDVLAHPDTS